MSRKKSTFDTEKLKKIGERIREIRNATGLDQSPFGKTIGISQTSVSDLENGKYPPSRPILLAIENQYSVSPDQILTGKGFPSPFIFHISEPEGEYKSQESQLLKMVSEVLRSEYGLALAANIHAFHSTIQKDREREELKKEIEGLKKEMANLEERLSEINSDLVNHVEDGVER